MKPRKSKVSGRLIPAASHRRAAKRLTRKLKAIRQEMKARLHAPVKVQHQWLCQVLRGHYGYYGVIFNSRSLHAFYEGVKRSWLKALQRRSQKSRMNWHGSTS